MRTLHIGLRVADADRAAAFYAAVGYEVVGRVPDSPAGQLTMLKLPDDELVALELVHDPAAGAGQHRGSGLSHLVIQVDAMDLSVAALRARGIEVAEPRSPNGSDDFLTSWITDPDGNRIELVQWPPGHAVGLTAADWA
ncbi:methylmalonyl-CoA epimerase [Friedmanniella luteola]|uniref:Methylmalonyl-CoA epimerase n=1 Tax=Friedmanniella luteola TaxID=546871 RepID=A0A1H1T3A8_9ACTN|nr:VOC family protein [Friedmanniella luteola]SDS54671.1 methylmalonyl-CoA epimerase [Friedmanniella luteola]